MIGSLARLRRMPPHRRRALMSALVMVPAARVALWVVPFRILHRAVRRIRPAGLRGSAAPGELAAAVHAVARRIPDATCLTQAIALYVLLARNGYRSAIHIGVARRAPASMIAHAWVEHDGTVLIGGGPASTYTPLFQLQGDQA